MSEPRIVAEGKTKEIHINQARLHENDRNCVGVWFKEPPKNVKVGFGNHIVINGPSRIVRVDATDDLKPRVWIETEAEVEIWEAENDPT